MPSTRKANRDWKMVLRRKRTRKWVRRRRKSRIRKTRRKRRLRSRGKPPSSNWSKHASLLPSKRPDITSFIRKRKQRRLIGNEGELDSSRRRRFRTRFRAKEPFKGPKSTEIVRVRPAKSEFHLCSLLFPHCRPLQAWWASWMVVQHQVNHPSSWSRNLIQRLEFPTTSSHNRRKRWTKLSNRSIRTRNNKSCKKIRDRGVRSPTLRQMSITSSLCSE